jgi:outer membrane protein TolC
VRDFLIGAPVRRLLENRDAEVQARAAAARAAVASFRALGGGWDAPREQAQALPQPRSQEQG